MNAEQLKASIFQQAIEGKLVPQLGEEGTVARESESFEDVPFDIPESWGWILVEDLSVKRRTVSPKDLQEQEVELWSIPAYDAGKPEIVAPKAIGSLKKIISVGDVLLSKIIPHIKRAWVVSENGSRLTKLASTEWLVYRSEKLLPEYLAIQFKAPYFRARMMECVSGMGSLKRTNPKALGRTLLPVPPVQEQKRIVAKIEELLPLIEAYGKSYDRLQELNAELPGKLKASILQEAIQGKLVPQLDSEEEVEQIGDAPEDVPFAIPENWKWVKIKSVFTMQAGKFISASSIRTEGKVPCYGGNGLRGYVDEANRNGHFPLIGRQGALCGNVHVVNGEFYATEHAVVVDCGTYGDPECVGLFLKAMNLNQYATATAQPGLSVKKIVELPFPLPPKSEQVRIASKVKELMKQVEALSGLEITS